MPLLWRQRRDEGWSLFARPRVRFTVGQRGMGNMVDVGRPSDYYASSLAYICELFSGPEYAA